MEHWTASLVNLWGKKYLFQRLATGTSHCITCHARLYHWYMETRGHRRLRLFLQKTELTINQLAILAEISPQQIYHLTEGRRRASLDVAAALERATNGAIKATYWTVVL